MNPLFVWEIAMILFSGIVYFTTLLSGHLISTAINTVVVFTIMTILATFFVAKEDRQVKLCFITAMTVIISCLNPILCFSMSFFLTAIFIALVDKTLEDNEFFSLLGENTIIYFLMTHGNKLLEKVMCLF